MKKNILFLMTAMLLSMTSVFAQGETYDIVLLAHPMNAGVVFGGGTYNDGETVIVMALPDDCWKFVNWTEDDIEVSADNPYSFTVTADRVLTANFEFGRQGYEITVLANPPEGGTVTGGGSFPSCGGEATVTAIPNDCYEFVNWTEDGVVLSTDPVYIFTVTKSSTLVANFEQKTYNIVTLANPPSGGTIIGDGIYLCGEAVTICAIPDYCYKFIDWTENGVEVSVEMCYTFIVTADRVLTANFEYGRQGYEITVLANPPEGGTVTGGGSFPSCGGEATVMAVPNDCYEFVNWTEDGVVLSNEPVYSFPVTKSMELVANFESLTGIADIATTVNIYPNPTDGKLQVTSYGLQVTDIEIFDVFGRNVLRLTSPIPHPISIDISHLSNGVYFIKIVTKQGEVVKKVVKH